MSSDDVKMGEIGRRFKKVQWEDIRNGELRSEAMRMAERLGEEMGSMLNRRMNRERGWRENSERCEEKGRESDQSQSRMMEEKSRRVDQKDRRIGKEETERGGKDVEGVVARK